MEEIAEIFPQMKTILSLKEILAEIVPLHRTLVSGGTDQALEIVGSYMPDSSNYTIENYAPLSPVWTWKIPERYVVYEAYLETEDGERIVDFKNNPLHLVSYSLPVDKLLTWEELQPHLFYSDKRPNAVPWMFKYYERDWGFCLPRNLYDILPRDRKYHAVIKSEFVTHPKHGMKVATGVIHPEGGENPGAGEMLIMAHICHPNQANDDAAGVVTAIEIARRLADNPLPAGSMSVRFWFGPETIGSIAYLANHEELIPKIKGGIFLEMTGNNNVLAFHHTHQYNHLLDRITKHVLQGLHYNERGFADAPANDERVLNGPGVNVPCISLNRFPYDEYHTSDDNLDIIHESMLVSAAGIAEEIIRIYASNYIPVRTFKGPLFLSGNGLWVDWREDWELNRALEKMIMCLDGNYTLFDIAVRVDLDYWTVRKYIEKLREKGFVKRLKIVKE